MKVNLALSEPPIFTARPSKPGEVAPHHHGTMHISPTLDYLEQALHGLRGAENVRAQANALNIVGYVYLRVGDPELALERFRAVERVVDRSTGYRGRIGIYEMMTMTAKVRELAFAGATTVEIRKAAVKGGMTTLYEDGINKVLSGITTLDEVFRVSKREQMD